MRLGAFTALCLLACPSKVEPPPPPMFDPCAGRAPVTLTAGAAKVRVRTPVALHAAGGEGHFIFTLKDGSTSGGEVLADRYVAGMRAGRDTVVATDRCQVSAEVVIDVVEAFAAEPERATVKPGTAFSLVTRGILGTAGFAMLESGSGGGVDATGRYTAGATDGVDWVSVKDSATGDEALLRIQVSSQARFRVDPARLALPSGGTATLHTQDGSGHVTWRTVSGPATVTEGGALTLPADATASSELEARDTFTQLTSTVQVRPLTGLTHAYKPHGRLFDFATVATADFDGDGRLDVAVGVPDSDLGAVAGGAVFVYLAGAQGLPAEPTWTLPGTWEGGQLGSSLAAGDLDGDGHADLAVGAPQADVAAEASGAVALYKFLPDGPRPLRSPLTGFRDARFGTSVAIADADGDGDADLFVGAPGADLVNSMTVKARGVVDVFLMQKAVPIADVGSLRLSGQDLLADGAVAQMSSNLFAGGALAVADLDGDGKNDLAMSVLVKSSLLGGVPRAGLQAAVQVHLSRGGAQAYVATPDAFLFPAAAADAAPATLMTLTAAPRLGTAPPLLVLGLDLLDAPDLTSTGQGPALVDTGGAVVFDGASLTPLASGAHPRQLGVADARARYYGVAALGLAGRAVTFADVDGQAGLELLLGAPGSAGATPRAGKLLAYPFASATPGATFNQPLQVRTGAMNDALGAGLGARGDQLLAVSGRASTAHGDFTGRLEVLAPAGQGLAGFTQAAQLDFPAKPAGQRFGVAVEAAQVAGALKVAVGAPGVSGPGPLNDGEDVGIGEVRLFDAAQPATSASVLQGGLTPASRGGSSVGAAVAFTDFDGDGLQDLVVGEPNFVVPASAARDELDPIYAQERPGCVAAAEQRIGAISVALGKSDGTFARAYRLWAPAAVAGCTPLGSAACTRGGGLGQGLAGGFDYDGDGKQDVAVLRSGAIEVFLGRAREPGPKLTMGCDPVYTSASALLAGPVVSLGDVDGDGCSDVAYRWVGLSTGFTGGVKVVFGFGAAACGATQRVLHLSAGPEGGVPFNNLGTAIAPVGRLFGGASRWVAMTAAARANGESTTAVYFYDAAQLAAQKPSSGEALVPALDGPLTPRQLLPVDRVWEWGVALAGGLDLTGDGAHDLVLTATGATPYSPAGTTYVFAGGAPFAAAPEPYLVAIGDAREQAAFGADLAVAPGHLVLGAPKSNRTGTQSGAAFLLTLP